MATAWRSIRDKRNSSSALVPNAPANGIDCDSCSYGGACNSHGSVVLDPAHRARAEERCRISRELHDSTSQLLVTIQLRMLYLKEMLDVPGYRAVFDEVEQALTDLHREIRVVAFMNDGLTIQEGTLPETLRQLAGRFGRMIGLDVSVHVNSRYVARPAQVASSLYRIAQEALANVHRHAGAKSVTVDLRGTKDELRLTITDDGVGISPERDRRDALCGLGLDNMRARARELGGRLTVRRLKRGTRISVTVPSTAAMPRLVGWPAGRELPKCRTARSRRRGAAKSFSAAPA